MTTPDITASLQKFWTAAGPVNVKTVFSGISTDVTDQSTWIEFWISQLTEGIRRGTSPTQMQLFIDIHLFSNNQNKRAINALVDSVRSTLEVDALPVYSADVPVTQVGQLRCFESVIRDLSRAEATQSPVALQHFVVSIPAVVSASLAS